MLELSLLLCLAAVPSEVQLRGALVMPEEVYRSVLRVPEGAPPSQALAEVLALQVERFLLESGYDLASVRGTVADGRMTLELHEGQLEKIVFRGRLTFNLMRFRLALDLPRDVFNRPALERQISSLARRYGLSQPPTWELIASQRLQHRGPQVGEEATQQLLIGGHSLVQPQQDWELHLFFADPEWSTGAGIDVRSSYFDGFELGPNYQGADLFLKGDRWRVAVTAGLGVRQDIINNAFYLYLSRGFLEAEWISPVLGPTTRMAFAARNETLNRQRRDLNLEHFWSTATELSSSVLFKPLPGQSVSFGLGVQHFFLFDPQSPPGGAVRAPAASPVLPGPPPPITRWRGFAQLGGELVFDDAGGRWDRRHALTVDARLWSSTTGLLMSELRASYQQTFAFGWHDFSIKGRGRWLQGDVLFAYEEPLGEYLRGVFGDVYTRAVLGLRAEFRFSLTRDVYKVGLFIDAATYAQHDPSSGLIIPRFGAAVGPGFHALVAGMFQVDVNLSLGVLTQGRFNLGLFVMLYKIF